MFFACLFALAKKIGEVMLEHEVFLGETRVVRDLMLDKGEYLNQG